AELFGCMSFNMRTFTKSTMSSKCKWYCLLPENIGKRKRMALNIKIAKYQWTSSSRTKCQQSREHDDHQTYPPTNYGNSLNGFLLKVDVHDRDEIQFGLGCPCTVVSVQHRSSFLHSTSTRPQPGDILVKINDKNVTRAQPKAVMKLMKNLQYPIRLEFYRRYLVLTTIPDKVLLNSVEQHQLLPETSLLLFKTDQEESSDENNNAFCSSDKMSANSSSSRSEQYILQQPIYNKNIVKHRRPETTKNSLLMSPIDNYDSGDGDSDIGYRSESTPHSDIENDNNRLNVLSESYRFDALKLIELEEMFIAQLDLGVQLYARPLKHYLISSQEHSRLFQNIEKILAISRYQLNKLRLISNSTLVEHVGKLFYEKVQIICEAFETYSHGYVEALYTLKQLEKCSSFQRFIQNINNEHKLTLEQFLQIPLKHIETLSKHLDSLCSNCQNPNDANYLLHVLKELRQCASRVIENSNVNQFSTTMTLNSATNSLSSTMPTKQQQQQQQPEDAEIVELQNRLQFPPNIKPISLIGKNRHVIFSGVLLLQNETKTYIDTWCLLLNDMLLFTSKNSVDDNGLQVICEPLLLSDIIDFRASEQLCDTLIFLRQKPQSPYRIRYPNKCFQTVWQTILDQRLKHWQKSVLEDSVDSDDYQI
ncbi:unnamed protein product, partial [Didymodactylos carnosus]